MAQDLDIGPELSARVRAVAARLGRSPADLLADALERGQSLDWQERFVAQVRAGLADAAAGRYAGPGDFERLRDKYRRS